MTDGCLDLSKLTKQDLGFGVECYVMLEELLFAYQAVRLAEGMKLFERNGKVHYGLWRRWYHAKTSQEADTVLQEFRNERTPP